MNESECMDKKKQYLSHLKKDMLWLYYIEWISKKKQEEIGDAVNKNVEQRITRNLSFVKLL